MTPDTVRGTLLPLLLCLVACTEEAPPPAVTFEVTDSAGISIVTSHEASWSSEEAWTVSSDASLALGAGDDEVEHFFGIIRVRLRSDGGVAVLDGGAAEVRVFDRAGTAVMMLGGDGDGPGELRGPRELHLLPDDGVVVWDNRPSYSTYDATGAFVDRRMVDITRIRTYMPDRLTIGIRGLADGSVMAVGYARPLDQVGTYRHRMLYARAAADGSWLDTLGTSLDREWWLHPSAEVRGRTLLGPASVWGSGGDPVHVAFGENGTARVLTFGPEGTRRDVVFPDDDRSVPPDVLEAAKDGRRNLRVPPPNLERFLEQSPQPEVVPAFGGLLFDDAGNLWVLPYFPDEGRTAWQRAPVARVFGPDGRLLGRVTLPTGLEVHDVGPDRIVGVRTDELGVEIVQVHTLSR